MSSTKPKNGSPGGDPTKNENPPRIIINCSVAYRRNARHIARLTGAKSIAGFARIAMAEFARIHFPNEEPLIEEEEIEAEHESTPESDS